MEWTLTPRLRHACGYGGPVWSIRLLRLKRSPHGAGVDRPAKYYEAAATMVRVRSTDTEHDSFRDEAVVTYGVYVPKCYCVHIFN